MDIHNIINAVTDIFSKAAPPVVDIPRGEGRKVIAIRDGYEVQTVDQRKAAARIHVLRDLGDLLRYADRAAEPEKATLFCRPEAFILLPDDFDEPGREKITYRPTPTRSAKDWLGEKLTAEARKLTHIKLKKFIEDHEGDLEQSNGLLTAVASFQAKTEFSYQAALGKGGSRNFGFSLKSGQVEGTVELPTTFTVKLRLFEGWEALYSVKFRLDWEQESGQAPIFTLEAANVQETVELVIDEMVAHAKKTLGDGWMIVRGEPIITTNQGQ
jgi:hypothetical protein